MISDLKTWTTRLEQHFTSLHAVRRAVPYGQMFALEHGLDSTEVKALSQAIREDISLRHPTDDHALAWIVYASELGYRYSGDEYWQTFEEQTPGWVIRGDRHWIRDCYRTFKERYGGAEPAGAWAEHFSIICWPITHAILPRDLQQQLARMLYELRHLFSADLFESPTNLGELIATRSWNATSRFQNLVQETQLVGQISSALLLQGKHETGNLIHPATLRRISHDLDQERRAREWLRGARTAAEERAKVRGLAFGRNAFSASARRTAEVQAQVAELGIEPRLVLLPTEDPKAWNVSLEIPDLSHLIDRFPQCRETLTNSRCVVAGAAGRPLARGRCLHGSQRVILSRWPQSDEVLLQFERTDSQLDYLLRTECLLRPGSTRLFRIATDGLAYELKSLRVRPGEQYVIVSQSVFSSSVTLIEKTTVNCHGVQAALLRLPSSLDSEWETVLTQLGLGHAKNIEVWPAGLAAAAWDGEGHGEWLASEHPCLAVSVDHKVDSLFVAIGNDPMHQLELKPVAPGQPTFVELPKLPVGGHVVRFSARKDPSVEAKLLGDLNVMVRIREARPWIRGISSQSPLCLQVDPPAPKLEELWEGRVDINLQGPECHRAKCTVTLFEEDQQVPLFSKQLPPISLPVSPEAWRTHFRKHFRDSAGAEAAYDSSRICEIDFNAEELGVLSLRCERELTPLRWSIRKKQSGFVARLLNDSGSAEQPVVTYFAFEAPYSEKTLNNLSEYSVPTSGGLYLAKLRTYQTAAIAPPTLKTFSDLRSSQSIPQQSRSIQSIREAIARAELWSSAKLVQGSISAVRRREVLNAIMRHIVGLIGGEQWLRAEPIPLTTISLLQDAISRKLEEQAIGVVLSRDAPTFALASNEDRVSQLASLGVRYLAIPSQNESNRLLSNAGTGAKSASAESLKITELALRLASDAGSVEKWAGDHLKDLLSPLIEKYPVLMRAARYWVLAIDHHLQSDPAYGDTYAGWRWT